MSRPRPAPYFDSVEAFDRWALDQDGRWELHDGLPIAMAPERVDHARIKTRTWQALDRSLHECGSNCEAILDGPLVPGPGLRRFQPDVLLTCGKRPDGDDLVVAAPLLIIEVVSPSSEGHDLGLKLDSYFALPSVRHYLVVFTDRRLVIQHSRHAGPGLLTTLHHNGTITLDPPGIVISLADMYAGSNLDED